MSVTIDTADYLYLDGERTGLQVANTGHGTTHIQVAATVNGYAIVDDGPPVMLNGRDAIPLELPRRQYSLSHPEPSHRGTPGLLQFEKDVRALLEKDDVRHLLDWRSRLTQSGEKVNAIHVVDRRWIEPGQDEKAVIQSVENWLMRHGEKFYFNPDFRADLSDSGHSKPVFADRGGLLYTSRDDAQTVGFMMDIVQARGWTQVHVYGPERFRQAAWILADAHGIGIKGYEPSAIDLTGRERFREWASRERQRTGKTPSAEERKTARLAWVKHAREQSAQHNREAEPGR